MLVLPISTVIEQVKKGSVKVLGVLYTQRFQGLPQVATISETLPEASSDYMSVFLPCTPNPTTGFWFYVPAKDVIEVSLTPDEAFKLIMSAGVIQPGADKSLADMAEATIAASEKPADAF
mgnify:CR=1 FL=1